MIIFVETSIRIDTGGAAHLAGEAGKIFDIL